MFRKSIILLLTFTLIPILKLSAQLTVNAMTQAATCSANGQVSVQATGGSGDYTYQLKGSCTGNIPPQQDPVFDFLPPCEYTVTVVDRQTNASGETTVEVADHYDDIVLSVMGEGCDQRLMVTGGRAPFRFYYSPDGIEGPYQLNDPPDRPVFQNLSGSDIHLGVEDACGIWRVIPTPAALNPIQSVEFEEATEEGVGFGVMGGKAPFSFRVFNDSDTLELTRAFISWDSLLCDGMLEVGDSCSSFIEYIYYEPHGSTVCVNFSAGTAEVKPVAGVPPYEYSVITPDSQYISNTGLFENLPINAGSYEFYITDACGREDLFDLQSRLHFDADESDLGCTDTELRLFPDRECGGALFPPLKVTCLNCVPKDSVLITSSGEEIIWSGYGPGEWDVLLENGCGDQTRCQDQLIVELTPACDSIVGRIVDLFTCDNGTNSRRVITGDDVSYFLYNENGTAVEGNNKTGVFENLSLGTYEVVAVLPNCDTLRNTTTIVPPEPIDPFMETFVSYEEENGACRLYYYLNIEKDQGPYLLTGGPNGTHYEELNDFGERNCRFYNVRLQPGEYTLTSMSVCGDRVLELPQPDYDFTVSLVDNCPGDAKILANGVRTYEEWQTYYEPYRLNVQNLYPGYFLEPEVGGSSEETGYTFRGLNAGLHTVYLFPLEETACPADTIDIVIPEYDPVAIEIAGDVVCDEETMTDLDIKLTGGQAPYNLRKLDCGTINTLATFSVDSAEVFVDENLPLDGYCYAVSDVCLISAEFQVKVRLFGDSIRLDYSCDGMLQLSVDSLPVSYTWIDERGQVISDQHMLSVPVSEEEETYTVQVGLPECVVERSVTVPPREIIPPIDIVHNGLMPVICEGADITLTAITDDENQFFWHTGETAREIVTSAPDLYIATAINDIGCSNSDTLEVIQVVPPEPEITGIPGFCLNEGTELKLDENYLEQLWSTGEQTASIVVAQPGEVSVIVTDDNGCTGRDTVEVVEWALPTPQIYGDTLICPGTVTEAGLTIPYAGYDWSNGSILPTANLPAGIHSVTVTDVNGCQERDEIRIEEKPQLYARLSGDTTICAGDSAFLSLSFTQSWYQTQLQIEGTDGENISLQTFGDTAFWMPVSNTTILQLTSVIMEEYGCTVIAQGMPEVRANHLNLVFRESLISCAGGSDGSLEVFAASDFPPYDIQWDNGPTTTMLTGLPEGVYRVRATDQLGCTTLDSFSMEAPQLIRPNLSIRPPLCRGIDDGRIALETVVGGTPPFVWQLDDTGQGFAPGEVVGLPPGSYTIEIRDRNNCLWDTLAVFPVPPALTIDAGPDQTITIGETAVLVPITQSTDLVYWQWKASPAMGVDSSLILKTSPLNKTNYTITVRNDYGCELTDEVAVFVNKDNQFDAPNAFSPDGDGRNDFFLLFGKTSNIESIELFEVYDRWGNKVFETASMELNNEPTGWNGRLNGQLLNAGVYVWMAKVKRIDGEEVVVYGDVALVR